MLYNEPNAIYIVRTVTALCDATSTETHICVELVSICVYITISVDFYLFTRNPATLLKCTIQHTCTVHREMLFSQPTNTNFTVCFYYCRARESFFLYLCLNSSVALAITIATVTIYTYYLYTVIYGKVKIHVISKTYNNTVPIGCIFSSKLNHLSLTLYALLITDSICCLIQVHLFNEFSTKCRLFLTMYNSGEQQCYP